MTRAGRALPISLFLAVSGLCALIGFEITDQRQARQSDLAPPVLVPSQAGTPAVSQPPDQHGVWFRQILARPLFSPDRKPIATNAPSAAGLPRLTGVVVTGTRRVAIFAGSAGGHPIVAEVDSHIGIYHVLDITDVGVTVAGPQGTTMIKPMFDAQSAVVAKAPLVARPDLSRPGTR